MGGLMMKKIRYSRYYKMRLLCYLFFFFLMSTKGWAAASYKLGQEKAVMCAACHGQKGMSVNPLWPHLAGQHAAYLMKQLNDFKKNKLRHSPIMAPFVASLTKEDMASLALYYSKQSLPVHSASRVNKRGEQLYKGGDAKKQITACIACHGPSGQGNALAGFPVISGQQADYALQQLQAFKNKTRKNDMNAIMRSISARMSKADMRAVASYLQAEL